VTVVDLDEARRARREPPVVFGRVPPHDLTAEAAVLSACILEPDRIVEVRGVLDLGDFYSEPNRLIYSAVLALDDAGAAIDTVTVGTWLRARELIQRVDVGYLGRIVDDTPAVAHVIDHAWIVVTCSRQRRAIEAMQRHGAEGYGDVGDPATWLATVRQSLMQATEHDRISLELLGDGARQLLRDLDEASRADATTLPGLTTEIAELDDLMGGLRAPDVYVVIAEASGGKTALALGWALTTALAGGGVYYWNGEPGQPKLDLLQRGTARTCGVDYGLIRNNPRALRVEDWDALRASEVALTEAPLLVDDRKQLHADQIAAACHVARRRLIARGTDLKLVVLDNLSELSAPPGTNKKNTIKSEWLMESARRLLKLGQELHVPVVLLAHLKKGTSDVYYCPHLKSLAQNLVRVRLEKATRERPAAGDLARPIAATLDVLRQRNGSPGQVSCWFHGALQRFSDEEWLR
jgi:replicative DNA helicase